MYIWLDAINYTWIIFMWILMESLKIHLLRNICNPINLVYYMETILWLIRHAMISDGPHSNLFPFSRVDSTKISVCSSQETTIPDTIYRALYEISVSGFQFWLCHLITMWLDKWLCVFVPLQNEEESQLNHFAERIRDMIKGDSMY